MLKGFKRQTSSSKLILVIDGFRFLPITTVSCFILIPLSLMNWEFYIEVAKRHFDMRKLAATFMKEIIK